MPPCTTCTKAPLSAKARIGPRSAIGAAPAPTNPKPCRHCRRKPFGVGAAIAPQDHPPCPPCLRESAPDQRRHPFVQLAPKTAPDVIGFETGQVGHVALLRA